MGKHLDGVKNNLINNSSAEKRSWWKEAGLFVLDVIKVAVVSLAIIYPVRTFLIQPFYVQGESMIPNFQEKEYLIIDEISYRFQKPVRGDTVVFHPPSRPDEFYIKRIIGLPGESILLRNGRVIIFNQQYPAGIMLDESSYLPANTMTRSTTSLLAEGVPLALGDNQYFVLGDNRANSQDSRAFGPLPLKNIVGRAWLRGWPISRVGSVSTPEYGL